MKVEFTPEQDELRKELRAYFKEIMTPELKLESEETMGEGGGPLWKAALAKMGRDGWIGLGWEKELGAKARVLSSSLSSLKNVCAQATPFHS
ncbi:acyl-CoA dehydrogenase family protein [Oceanicoccus sp. KOV_DT_Chl]|uniref:acyl-CoA dehydrogenase family protein n=1 Tax=Oceanicoccus sp. KOV_DT_Chl TaxID=1904639 RepID=UPI001F3E6A2D|nr:acyl-CoA dehydrogenase family protein [Oceanicoccus sp. KOV_DT_Chl]